MQYKGPDPMLQTFMVITHCPNKIHSSFQPLLPHSEWQTPSLFLQECAISQSTLQFRGERQNKYREIRSRNQRGIQPNSSLGLSKWRHANSPTHELSRRAYCSYQHSWCTPGHINFAFQIRRNGSDTYRDEASFLQSFG